MPPSGPALALIVGSVSSMSIADAFAWRASRAGDAAVVVCGDQRLTWSELLGAADAAAGLIEAGSVVPVSVPNSAQFVIEVVAAWLADATPMPLSPRIPEIERQTILDLAAAPGVGVGTWRLATSSGSTGRPKLIRAAAPAVVDPTAPVAAFVPHHARQLVAGPLFHAAPFTYAMRGLMTGHSLVIMERFDAGEWLELAGRERITWGMIVPTMMQRILRSLPSHGRPALPDLGAILHLGARCAPEIKRGWIDWLGPERITELYAGTESAGLAFISGSEWLEHPGSVGRGIGDSEFRIARPDGTGCEPGELGEIWMRRSAPTYSYVGARPREREGWHSLGDAGWLDGDGYLYVADRLDDLINSGGVKVQPAEVEAVLDTHPRVRSSIVVGRADDDLGERVHAVVEGDVTVSDLKVWVAERLDPEKQPRSWQLVDQELRGDTGKVCRSDWR